jgi:hypothetical protein
MTLRTALLLAVGVLASNAALAADEVFATADGAIRGYDAVAYHTEKRAVAGDASITHEWNGATWRLASTANRDAFAAQPERYAPRFGGYCAYGTAQGYKVSVDPAAFAIVDGALYLNYDADVQKMWDEDRPGYIATAGTKWKTLHDDAYESDEASVANAR